MANGIDKSLLRTLASNLIIKKWLGMVQGTIHKPIGKAKAWSWFKENHRCFA
jgi:hypothetical protein